MGADSEDGEEADWDDDGQTLPSEVVSPAGKIGLAAKHGHNGTGLTDAKEGEERLHEGALVK